MKRGPAAERLRQPGWLLAKLEEADKSLQYRINLE